MKKFLMLAVVAAAIIACNNNSSKNSSLDSSKRITDSSSIKTNSIPKNNSIAEGTMQMKGGKMMVMKNGQWIAMDKRFKCSDSSKVNLGGRVIRKEGNIIKLKEGMMVDVNGNLMDSSGKTIIDTTNITMHKKHKNKNQP